MDYDAYKLMTPEEANGTANEEYVPISAEVEIYNPEQCVLDAIKGQDTKFSFDHGEPYITTTICINALLTCDDYEKECYVQNEDVVDAIRECLGGNCEYEILNWERI